jgi:hypothetical protein
MNFLLLNKYTLGSNSVLTSLVKDKDGYLELELLFLKELFTRVQ